MTAPAQTVTKFSTLPAGPPQTITSVSTLPGTTITKEETETAPAKTITKHETVCPFRHF